MPRLATPFTDLATCKASLSVGSRSFWLASQLLPPALKNAACGLYAFCRDADDLIDEGDDPKQALRALHQRLDRLYAGQPDDNPVDRVLAQVIEDHKLPRALLDALLEGFAWDNAGRRYASLSEVYAYSARVAGSVGVMMALIMGVRDSGTLARAADLGVAMQLTNIARDVGEDARAGRLYLPTEELISRGVDIEQFLAAPRHQPAVAEVTALLLEQAAMLYRRSETGIAVLPRSCRSGIYGARLLYAAIGDQLAKNEYNAVDQRSIVDRGTKTRLVMRALTGVPKALEYADAAALPECQYLIDMASLAGARTDSYLTVSAPRAFYQRLAWMLEVFEHLDRRQH